MISIAVTSFKEAIRKKLFILVSVITLIYLILFGVITFYAARDIARYSANSSMSSVHIMLMASQIVSIIGFYFSNMMVAFFTVVASVGAISSEVENGTLHSIITKPIKRSHYVLGKYLGLSILLVTYAAFLYFAVLGICWVVKLPIISGIDTATILKGLGYFILEPLAILSLSIFGGVFFRTLANGILVASIYVLGLIGGMVEQIGALIKNNNLFEIGILSSLISPFEVIYRQMVSSLFSSFGFSNPFFAMEALTNTAPSKWMVVYIFVYIIGLASLAIIKFNKKDIA